MPRGMSVPQTGFETAPPAVGAQSPNHWTAREVPSITLLMSHFFGKSFIQQVPLNSNEIFISYRSSLLLQHNSQDNY